MGDMKNLFQYIDKNLNENVTDYFDQIDFKKLPDSFVIKCNHGCKWQYIIKDKKQFLKNKQLFERMKRKITGWLEQNFAFYAGFELQYLNIKPKIIIEKFLGAENETVREIEVYCFNGKPLNLIVLYGDDTETIYDENLNITNKLFLSNEKIRQLSADEIIKQTIELSKKLSEDFDFVRVDWMIYQNKLYFEELTFTPYSGFHKFKSKKSNIDYGKYIKFSSKISQ